MLETLTLSIIQQLVNHPDRVYVREGQGETTLNLEVTVDQADAGRVIGQRGQTIQALRRILRAVGGRTDHRVTLELLTVDTGAEA